MAKLDYTKSSGNVFEDLAFADSEEMLIKAELAQKIGVILHKRRLTQVQAAEILGVDQPKVSALLCGRLTKFSLERLMQFLLLLGRDVAITIRPRKSAHKAPRVRSVRRGTPKGRGSLSVVEIAPAKALRV